ncbi:E3 ubiquitin-protein ligase TRIM71-like [Saccostrea echinata]|uniref:E3 ubiquitin-protein ligase TRIM71-like n=1 Tax=Saccostrea echinata TaxID=191078 RepID=UPI002A834E30|nr:E3 ubiquitin-protein ligase TRIM71-like [Saccostrea echinata]
MAISSDMANPKMQTPVNCDTCENTAEHLCKTCHDRLCHKCKDIHSRSKGTFDHEVVLLTYESLTLSHECPSHLICKWHPNFRANIGCQECEVPVCEKCLIGEHNGHKLMDFTEMFYKKKEKLELKLSTVCAELPKYEATLKKIIERKALEMENNEIVKKEIRAHLQRVISELKETEKHLEEKVDEREKSNLEILKVQEDRFLSHVRNMKDFMSSFQTNDMQKRSFFILYANCTLGVTMPDECPSLSFPGIIKYLQEEKENLNRMPISKILGMLYSFAIARPLSSAAMVVLQSIAINKGPIESLCSQLNNNVCSYWIFSKNTSEFMNFDSKGNCLSKVNTNIQNFKNKPICVTEVGMVIFRKSQPTLYATGTSSETLFVDLTPLLPVCMCLARSGDILVAAVHMQENVGAVVRYNCEGKCLQRVTHLWEKMIPKPIFKTNNLRAYISENINGDICLSIDVVNVICTDGVLRFTYTGKEASLAYPFLPRGICTDILGNILIADENNHGIHVLDKDGKFLSLLTIPVDDQVNPISVCVDYKNDLCVGCSDGKIRIINYLS